MRIFVRIFFRKFSLKYAGPYEKSVDGGFFLTELLSSARAIPLSIIFLGDFRSNILRGFI